VKLYPARAQTTLYRVNVTCLIADDAGKTDATLTPGSRRFDFDYSLSRHCNARMGLPTLPSCYIVVFSEREREFTFAICYRPSVCLSSVTFVRPTQAVEIFGNISTALGTLAIR